MFCPKTRYRPNSCFHIHVRLGHYYAHSAEGNSQQSNLHGTHKKFFEKNAIVEQFEDEKRCPKKKSKRSKYNLANRRANELAAKNYVTEQYGEVPSRLRIFGLLVQHETSYGHQICPHRIPRVIHFSAFCFHPTPTFLHIWNRSCLYNIIILVFLLQSSHFLLSFIFILARGVAHKAE